MGKIKRLFVGGMLFLGGLGIFFYPNFQIWKIEEEVNQIEEQIETHHLESEKSKIILQKEKKVKDDLLYWEMKEYNQLLVSDGQELVDVWSYEEIPVELKYFKDVNQGIGYIEIPDMKVKLPLLIGASEENLAKGAGILSETSMPVGGKDTNCVIAAHRGWKGSPYFQYIENMDYGSIVYIHTLWETRVYQVVEFKIVDSYDLDSILIQKGKDMVTLMSCHPYGAPGGKLRYLVYCEYVEQQDRQETKIDKNQEVNFISEQKEKAEEKSKSKERILWEDISRFILPGIIGIYFLFRIRKRK